jgi:hypothetical protein
MANLQKAFPTMDGFRPITEGYQPGAQFQKGYTPQAVGKAPKPPTGGSSASKPVKLSAAAGMSPK